MSIEYTDRYDALGVPRPDPAMVCHGPCEGLGVYPDMGGFPDLYPSIDDVPFLTCEDCGGSGRR